MLFNTFYKKHSRSTKTVINIIISLLIILASIYASHLLQKNQNAHLQQNIATSARMFGSYLNHDMDINTQPIVNMVKRWQMRDGIPRREWEVDATSIVKSYPSVQAVEWIDRNKIVQWIVPLKGNEQALHIKSDFNLTRHAALQASVEYDKPRFSGIINLVQGGKGFLYFVPINDHKKNFDGFMVGVYRLNKFIKHLFSLHEYNNFNINIYSNNKLILQDINNDHVDSRFAHSVPFIKNNINWRIELIPSKQYIAENNSILPMAILVAGILFAIAIFLILTLLNISNYRAQEIKINSQQLDMTLHTIAKIAETNEFDQAIRSVLSFICQRTDWPVGHAFVLNKEKDTLITSGFWYVTPTARKLFKDFVDVTKKMRFKYGEGLPGRVWESKEPTWINDIHQEVNFPRAKSLSSVNLHSAFAFPVFDDADNLIIILEFFSQHIIEKDGRFLDYLKTLSLQLSNAVERLAMEDKIRISELKYRSVIEGAVNAIIMMNHKGEILECNQATDELFGRNELAIIGDKLSDYLTAPHDQEIEHYIKRYLESGTKTAIGKGMEITVKDKNSNPLPIYISISEIVLEGDVYFIAMLQDMSSQKHTEKALKSSQARELMLRYISDGIYGVDLLGRVTFANPAALNMLGYREEEVLEKDMHVLFHHTHPDGSPFPASECPMHMAIQKGKPYSSDDAVFWDKNNQPVHIIYHSTPMRKDGKLIGSAITIKKKPD